MEDKAKKNYVEYVFYCTFICICIEIICIDIVRLAGFLLFFLSKIT